MSNQSHTPEPWQINDDEHCNFVYALNTDGTNRFHFSISGGYVSQQGKDSTQWERTSREEIKANALLCVKAPAMQAEINALKTENANLRAGLLLAARWGISSDGYSASVASELRAWIIDDMRKPAPTAPDYYPTKP